MKKNEKKLTVRYFRKKKRDGEKIVALSLYDAPSARLADENGVELILVGDSLGMVVLGHKNTLSVTMEDMLRHTAAVVRGTHRALVVSDMPFLSYQISAEEALRNAGRLLREGGADAVKVEGGHEILPTVERLVLAGIPVMCHVGCQPQRTLTSGGYRVVGRTEEEAARLIAEAKALQDAGAFSVVLECVAAEISGQVSAALEIPTIGIGAGPLCDGQILVSHDLIGFFPDFTPKHAKRYVEAGALIGQAYKAYADDVRGSVFPGPEHSFNALGEASPQPTTTRTKGS